MSEETGLGKAPTHPLPAPPPPNPPLLLPSATTSTSFLPRMRAGYPNYQHETGFLRASCFYFASTCMHDRSAKLVQQVAPPASRVNAVLGFFGSLHFSFSAHPAHCASTGWPTLNTLVSPSTWVGPKHRAGSAFPWCNVCASREAT